MINETVKHKIRRPKIPIKVIIYEPMLSFRKFEYVTEISIFPMFADSTAMGENSR
jgi:hypothetical protein